MVRPSVSAFGQNSRWINNDELCVHENLLLDVAAGVRFLRGRGFERIVVCGNSGGGSLYAFYIAQSSTSPPASASCAGAALSTSSCAATAAAARYTRSIRRKR